jgi:hypothetical protein
MSYRQFISSSTRFTILSRTTSATLSKNSTFPFQTSTTVGGAATGTTQPGNSLIIAELRCDTVNADPAAEWLISGGSFATKALDQIPNAISTVAGNAYACTLATGQAVNSIFVTSGGVASVDDLLMTGTHAISYS